MVGGEDEAGSSRPCRPETPARQHKQAAPGTQGGRILLCVRVCVSGSEKRVTRAQERAVGGESCDGRAILYYGNNKSTTSRAGQRKRQSRSRPEWDGRTCVLIRGRGRADPSARLSRALHSPTPLTHGSPLSSLPAACCCCCCCGLAGWHMLAPVGAGGIGTLGWRSRRGSLRRYIFGRFMMGQMGYQGAQILQSLYPGPRQALGP